MNKFNIEKAVDRYRLFIKIEAIDIKVLSKQIDVPYTILTNANTRAKSIDPDVLAKIAEIYPEYGYWLAIGKELPESGQISPLTKVTKKA